MEFMPELIANGYIYAAQPPLYIVRYKGEVYYVLNDKELEEFNKKHIGEKSVLYLKGLGEISAKDFSNTVLDKEKRALKRITMKDAEQAKKLFIDLMGKDVAPRQEYLAQYGNLAVIE